MNRSLAVAVGATAVAIVVTSTMDASGLTAFSALPLFPLAGAVLLAMRASRGDAGLRLGSVRDYMRAVAYPVIVIGLCAAIALGTGGATLARVSWGRALGNVALVAAATVVVALITEEGFFRGALWAALGNAGLGRSGTLLWTSVAFALWHVSAVTLPTGFDLPRAQIPLFLLNAAILGAAWGVLRLRGGSILVSSMSHGLWNGMAYALFGYGTKVGSLGIARTDIYGPEVGVVGLTLNAVALGVLLVGARPHFSDPTPTAPVHVLSAP